jgi:asparagine synthase (glutamine-hydrolysing)
MGGIAGIFWLDSRPADVNAVEAMLTAIGHRGLHAPRLLACGPSTIISELPDKSGPATTVDVGPAVVMDARLDNASGIAKRVASRNGAANQALLFDAYQLWGASCAQRLLGDFAIAIWDERWQQLVCMRDQFGARPLFYHHIPGKLFAFGSEVKALLTIVDVIKKDQAAIADYLAWYHDAERTFYEGIRRLPPGHTLTVSSARLVLDRYWTPDPTRTIRHASDADYAEAFREIFSEAVQCRVETSAGLGAELSGGLDSSSVVCMARQLMSGMQKLSTFSLLLMEDPRYDERAFMDAVACVDGLKAEYLDVTNRSPLRHIESVSRVMDGPAPGGILSDVWELHAHASRSGVDVILDGCEGDLTVYHNFRYLAELARNLRWLTMLREARDINRLGFHGSASWWWVLRRYCAPFLLPSWLVTAKMMRYIHMLQRSDTHESLIRKHFAVSTGILERLAIERRKAATLRSHRENHASELTHPGVAKDMEVADHIGAAFAIARPHPFYDRRLVEFCLALPREQLVCKGWTRPVLRRAVGDVLPAKIYWRGDKVGVYAPRRLARLERHVLEETARDDETLGEYVDMGRLRIVTARYLDGDARVGDSVLLWPALSLRYWLLAPTS